MTYGIVSVSRIDNGFLVKDESLGGGTRSTQDLGGVVKLVLSALFERYYYETDEQGNCSDEWREVMEGLETFRTINVGALIAIWRKNASEAEKEFAEATIEADGVMPVQDI